jgi:hypothetical protein
MERDEMEIQAAITQVRNAKVAVVWVNHYALQNGREAAAFSRQLEANFAMPVVLAASGRDRKMILFSQHEDLIAPLAGTALFSLPWERYNVA